MTADEYNVRNDELFRKWREKHLKKYGPTVFIRDGIISPEDWFGNNPPKERILFLLKEAYDKEENTMDWDETKWLKQEKCMDICSKKIDCSNCNITGNTFNFVASVAYGILESETKKYDPWIGIESRKNSLFICKRKEMLKKIAIINIKKSRGKKSSSDDDIYYYAADDKDLLIEQIKLISPTIIICGGTYKYLRCIFTDLPQLEDLSDGLCKYESMRIIAAPHPNSHSSGEERYNRILSNYL